MLRLTLDLLPGGSTRAPVTLGVATIANESGLAGISDYSVHVVSTVDANEGAKTRTGAVHGFDRDRPAWELVAHAIFSAVGMPADCATLNRIRKQGYVAEPQATVDEWAKEIAELRAKVKKARRFKGWRCVVERADGQTARKQIETLAGARAEAKMHGARSDVTRAYVVRVYRKARTA